jgi:hypothetical protein
MENDKNLPRCDYKEFLELAKLILGETTTRKKGYSYHLQRPGADHHARWMSKCIYTMKMCLLLHQLPDVHWQMIAEVPDSPQESLLIYLCCAEQTHL